MPAPIDGLRFIHEAITTAAARLEDGLGGALDASGAAAMREEVELTALVIDLHTRGEEIGLFPRLVAIEPHFAETYLHDHDAERARYAELAAMVGRVAEGDTGPVPEIQRLVVALREHTDQHVDKENRFVLPFVAERFSVEEQAEMVQKILSTISPADMQRALPWIVDRLGDDTAVAYVTMLGEAMPPPVFEAAKGWIRERCARGRVAMLEESLPTLR